MNTILDYISNINKMNKYMDNLFNADHRRAMQEKYNFTEAQVITVKELNLLARISELNPYMPADKQNQDQIPPEVDPEENELVENGDKNRTNERE
jgi:hypothetical protein